ncbi:MAG: NAD(P)/FAD-dependent oxidoreductase, partial [Bdellovibrio sp.]
DFLNFFFTSSALKAAIALPAHSFTFTGPRSPLTAFSLFYLHARAKKPIPHGAPQLLERLLEEVRKLKITVKTNTPVKQILFQDQKVCGVETEDYDVFKAPKVISTCDPHTTAFKFLSSHLPANRLLKIKHQKIRSTTAIVALGLKGQLQSEFIRMVPSLEALEKAFDPIKYGQFPSEPALNIWNTTHYAPEGHSVALIHIHFIPPHYHWTPEEEKKLLQSTINTLSRYNPDISDRIVCHKLLTPEVLQKEYLVTGGHIFHSEQTLDQLINAPFEGFIIQ